MAQYPNEIYTPREKENQPGIVFDPNKKNIIFAEDIKALDDEVKAIEEVLGTNPILIKKVAVLESIDLTEAGEYILYEVPAGKKFRFHILDVVLKNVQNPAFDGEFKVIRASDNKEIGGAITGGIDISLGVSGFYWDGICSSGDVLKFIVSTPESGEVFIVDIYLFGYLIPD